MKTLLWLLGLLSPAAGIRAWLLSDEQPKPAFKPDGQPDPYEMSVW